MFFVLKKIIGGLLLPLPLLLALMTIGLGLLCFSRRRKSGITLVALSALILLLLSLRPVSDALLSPLEHAYPTRQHSDGVKDIVVLGGGYTWDPTWAPSSNLSDGSLARLAEAIRLRNMNPGARLIFTGYAAAGNPISTAEAGARVAESLGVPRAEIITLDSPRDTEEEAAAIAQLLGNTPFILVTAASHLPRAMIFFHRQGLHPLPAPANQMVTATPRNFWETAFPSPAWLMRSQRAIYERLGLLWQAIKGTSSHAEALSVPKISPKNAPD